MNFQLPNLVISLLHVSYTREMNDNLSNLDKTGRCWIVLFRITYSPVAVCQKASHFATRASSFFLFFFPTTLRGRCFWVLVWTMGGVECPFCCCMRGPDISIIAVSAAYFHVFSPELVLELFVLSLCKSALKTKESIKAQNK